MFELVSENSWVETRPEEVIDIYSAINRPTVAPPDRVPEPAHAFIATVYAEGGYLVYIYLYLVNSNEGLLYRWDEGAVAGDVVPMLYQNALEFTESMGFMMDNMRYRDKTPEEKAAIFAEVPMFHDDLSFMAAQGGGEEEGLEELVIESVDEDAPEVEAVAEEADEINLDVLTESDDYASAEEVTEITLGEAPADDSVVLGGDEEAEEVEEIEAAPAVPAIEEPGEDAGMENLEDSLLDSLETASEPAAEAAQEEDQALSALEVEEAPVEVMAEGETMLTPEEAQVLGALDDIGETAAEPGAEETVFAPAADEQTLEGMSVPSAVLAEEPAVEELSLTDEEARLLEEPAAEPEPAMEETPFEEAGLEIPMDEPGPGDVTEEAPPPAMAAPLDADLEADIAAAEKALKIKTLSEDELMVLAERARFSTGPSEPAIIYKGGDMEILVRFLAMM